MIGTSIRRARIAGGDRDPAVVVARVAVGAEKLVYVIAGNKRLAYGRHKSRRLYRYDVARGLIECSTVSPTRLAKRSLAMVSAAWRSTSTP